MYERRSRLSKAKRDRLVEHFVAGTTARAAAELVGVHRNTAASFYTRIRTVIAEETQKATTGSTLKPVMNLIGRELRSVGSHDGYGQGRNAVMRAERDSAVRSPPESVSQRGGSTSK